MRDEGDEDDYGVRDEGNGDNCGVRDEGCDCGCGVRDHESYLFDKYKRWLCGIKRNFHIF